jgi:hypothetical protein
MFHLLVIGFAGLFDNLLCFTINFFFGKNNIKQSCKRNLRFFIVLLVKVVFLEVVPCEFVEK